MGQLYTTPDTGILSRPSQSNPFPTGLAADWASFDERATVRIICFLLLAFGVNLLLAFLTDSLVIFKEYSAVGFSALLSIGHMCRDRPTIRHS